MKHWLYLWLIAILLATTGGSSAAFADDITDQTQPEMPGHFGPSINNFASPGDGGGSAASNGGGSLPRFGVGVKVSVLLGIGIEAATAVTQKSNVRGGFNFFNYTLNDTTKGFDYSVKMQLRSAQATYDWFPFGGGFHLSPGILLYNGNKISGTLTAQPGKKITINSTDYISNPANPTTGTAEVDLNSNAVAPMFLFGWGNLLRRKGHHFSVNFEMGAAFVGDPKFKLALTGGVCPVIGGACVSAASDPGVQSNIQAQQNKTNNDLKGFSIFPVISIGAGWRF